MEAPSDFEAGKRGPIELCLAMTLAVAVAEPVSASEMTARG
jgi:hypothetical protein